MNITTVLSLFKNHKKIVESIVDNYYFADSKDITIITKNIIEDIMTMIDDEIGISYKIIDNKTIHISIHFGWMNLYKNECISVNLKRTRKKNINRKDMIDDVSVMFIESLCIYCGMNFHKFNIECPDNTFLIKDINAFITESYNLMKDTVEYDFESVFIDKDRQEFVPLYIYFNKLLNIYLKYGVSPNQFGFHLSTPTGMFFHYDSDSIDLWNSISFEEYRNKVMECYNNVKNEYIKNMSSDNVWCNLVA